MHRQFKPVEARNIQFDLRIESFEGIAELFFPRGVKLKE